MAAVSLLDGTLTLKIYYEQSDREFEDDICLCFMEDSDDDEKLFRADEISIYITPHEAGLLILELTRAMEAMKSAGSAE